MVCIWVLMFCSFLIQNVPFTFSIHPSISSLTQSTTTNKISFTGSRAQTEKNRTKKIKKENNGTEKPGCSSIHDILVRSGMAECTEQKKWCNLVENSRENFIMNMAPVRWSKLGLQKDNHVCDMFLWTDENLGNLERNNCYKNDVCTFWALQHYSW